MVNPSGWLWIITLPQSERKSHNTFHRPATRRPASGGQTTATFLLVVKGTPSWTYLFQKNGTSLSVATGAIYTTPITTAEDSGSDLRCCGEQYGRDGDQQIGKAYVQSSSIRTHHF